MFSSFTGSGGTDYGGPVRNVAKELTSVLMSDSNIRSVRQQARGGENILVPMGETSVSAWG
jgi:hypothetical protein